MSRRVVIEFLGKDVSAGKTMTAVEGKTSKWGSRMQKVGAVAGKALAGGAILAAGGLYKLSQGAADDEQAQVKLATALKQSTGATDSQVSSVEDWITAQGKATGITDDELRPALGRLADATGSVEKAQKLSALAMDVSAGTGKDFGSVVEALVKAQNGSVGGLGRLGVATKKANGDTKSLKDITADLADTYEGRAAKAADTTAGKQKILTTQLSELGEQIGAKVLPVMLKLSDIGLKMVDWVSKNTTTVGILVGVLAGLAAVVWAVGAAVKVYEAATKVAAAAQWLWNAAMDANPIGLVVIAIAALVAGLVIAYKKSETFRKIVNGALSAVKKVALAVFGAVKKAAMAVWGWLKSAWGSLKITIIAPFQFARDFITNVWNKLRAGASAFKGFVTDKFNAIVDFFKRMPSRISHAASGMWDGIKDAFRSAINWLIEKWNNLAFSMPSVNTHIPGVGTIGGWSLGTPDIPYLAKGGIVTRPTLAMLGERGPEAVLPLSRGGGMGATNVYININGALDPTAVARQVEELLVRRVRSTGRPLQFRTI